MIKVDVLVQTQITNVTGKTVTEGGNVTLKCLAEGNPTPTVMWTRLSDNSVVTMPLTNIRRQNASVGYRCTANNGVKSPATRDVFLDVQYKPDHVSLNMSITNKVCTGMAVTFTCSAGAAKPAIQNYTLYKFVAGLTYISSNQFGIYLTKFWRLEANIFTDVKLEIHQDIHQAAIGP
ncbi:igLON family member 5-like isoform X1 [Acropora palmata]|uniref:igLON family member 5-like isoform X1 n=1 Tax=Acropora palmata TaxID=6131 RepID=UPI003DA05139